MPRETTIKPPVALDDKWKIAFQSVEDIIMFVDLEGRITDVNRNFEFRSISELIGKPIDTFTKEAEADRLWLFFKRAIKIKKTVSYETFTLTPDGTIIYLNVSFNPIVEDGDISEIVVIAKDITSNKRKKIQLLEKELQFRSTFEQTNIAIAHCSLDGKIILANVKFCKLFDITPKFAQGLDTDSLLHGNAIIKSKLYGLIANDQKAETSIAFIDECSRKNGTKFTGKIQLDLAIDSSENIVKYAILVIQDVTAALRSKMEVEIQKNLLESLISQSSEGIVAVDSEKRKIIWNQRMTELVGSNRDIPIHEWANHYQIYSTDQKTKLETNDLPLVRAMSLNKRIEDEFYIKKGGNSKGIHLRVHSNPLRDADDHVVGGISILSDITEQILAKEKLEKSEKKFRDLVESAPDGLVILDQQLKIVLVNTKFEKLFDVHRMNLIGKPISDLIEDETWKNSKSLFKELKQFYISHTDEYVVRFDLSDQFKREFYLEVTLGLIESASEMMIACDLRDITRQVQVDNQIKTAIIDAEEKERSRFASDLHDGLGQNIAAASMFISAISDAANESFDKKSLDLFNTCAALIQQSVLETRLISHNIMPNSLKLFGLHQALRELIQNLKLIYKDSLDITYTSNIKGIRLEENVELTLYRVIQEITNNTLKHAKASRLCICINKKNSHLMLEARDNGIGIDETTDVTGLGLKSIKNRIDSLNGEFKISSENDKGTCFEIKLKLK